MDRFFLCSSKIGMGVSATCTEKKYGDGTLNGNSGITKHFEDLFRFLSDQSKEDKIEHVKRFSCRRGN